MTEPLLKVNEIICDYFTEDHVDFLYDESAELGTFLIWFPRVTVTNETDDKTDVYDLFVRFSVHSNGKLVNVFQMGKTTYTKNQLLSRYLHSHCSGYPEHGVNMFYSCCLGTGPLVRTISTLMSNYDEAIWRLFCGELDLYTQTESRQGVPYRYISSIGGRTYIDTNFVWATSVPSQFVSLFREGFNRVISEKLIPFTFNHGLYKIAMHPVDLTIAVSDCLLSIYDANPASFSNCLRVGIAEAVLRDGKLYSINGSYNESLLHDNFDDTYIVFKGEHKMFRIIDNQDDSDNVSSVRIISQAIIKYFLSAILFEINTKYNNEQQSEQYLPF